MCLAVRLQNLWAGPLEILEGRLSLVQVEQLETLALVALPKTWVRVVQLGKWNWAGRL